MARPKAALAPAASRMSRPAAAPDRVFEPPPAVAAIHAFEKALGGRAQLAAELLTAPDLTPAIRKVLTLILDPRFDRTSLGVLCAQADLTPGQLFGAFRDATVAKATIHAIRLAAARLPRITTEILDDAVTHPEVCSACNGTKVQIIPARRNRPETAVVCVGCKGTGEILVRGDFEKQKFAFELTGILKKGPTIAVDARQDNRSISVGGTGAGGTLAQLQQAIGPILFNRSLTPAPPDADRDTDSGYDTGSDVPVDVAVEVVDNAEQTDDGTA